MKKMIIGVIALVLVITLILIYFNNKDYKNDEIKNNQSDEVSNNNDNLTYDDEYIEVIPENSKPYLENLDNEVLKSKEEIEELNKEIFEKSESMFDLSITSISKDEILKLINNYKLPTLPKYNGSTPITSNDTKVILENRNLDKVETISNIKHGIIVERANLRSFPSSLHFYESKDLANFDMLQETELLVGSEVLIIHESLDSKWYFVITETYAGWVLKDNIALLNDNMRNFFFDNNNFIVVTSSSVTINNKVLDMSVKLPFLKTNEDGYVIALPSKKDDGYVEYSETTIKRSDAHIGYLDYTKRNVIIEAFKYEGVPYSWSGLDKNVDCSSYVSNIYRTFGIKFPRNTSSQNKSIGKITSLSNKSNQEKLKLLENTNPSLLYQSGHVLLYIGSLNNKHYVIHASGDKKNLKVMVSELENSSYLSNIYQINEI